MSTEKQAAAAELPSQPFVATPTVLPAAPWHRPTRSPLRDTTRIILPVAFFIHFLITGTVVLIYTLYLQQQIPPKYSIGAAITFGILISLILTGHLLLYYRKRFGYGHGAERGSTSGSEKTNGTSEGWAWIRAIQKYLVEYETKSREGFREFHKWQRRTSRPKSIKTEMLESLDQKLDSLSKKLDGRLSKLLTTGGGREVSAAPLVLALPEPPLQQNLEARIEVPQIPDSSELCATNENEQALPEARPVRTTFYEGPNDIKQSFEMDASLPSNLPPALPLPHKIRRKRVPSRPIHKIATNDRGTLPSMAENQSVTSCSIRRRSAKNDEISKNSVVPPEDQLVHRHDSPDILIQPIFRPQMERQAAAPNPVLKIAPESGPGVAAFFDPQLKQSGTPYPPSRRNGQIRAITRERLEQQSLKNHVIQPSYEAYRKPPNPQHRQSNYTNFSDISPNLDAILGESHDDGDVSPMIECATLAVSNGPGAATETQELPIATYFMNNPGETTAPTFGYSYAAGSANEGPDSAVCRTRIPIAKSHSTQNPCSHQSRPF